MDTLTDLLSTFFVTRPGKKRHDEKDKSDKGSINEISESRTSEEDERDTENSITQQDDNNLRDNTEDQHAQHESQEHKSSKVFDVDESTFSATNSTNFGENDIESESSKHESCNILQKRYILRAIDMYRKNIIIVNNEQTDNIAILGDLLHTFSLMKKIEEIYNKTVYIVSSGDNRNAFKTMLLENPYLYFTDFKIKHSLGKQKIKELIENNEKRTMIIVHHTESDDLQQYLELSKGNIQLVVLGKMTKTLVDMYKELGSNKLLLHRKEKLKSLQKLFFDKVLRQICKVTCTFQEYFNKVNADTFGIRYIVIKSDELRYV